MADKKQDDRLAQLHRMLAKLMAPDGKLHGWSLTTLVQRPDGSVQMDAYACPQGTSKESSMADRLTPEFPPHIKPCRPGIYKTRIQGVSGHWFSYWTGKIWSLDSKHMESAALSKGHKSWMQRRHWRGLAADPAIRARSKT